MSHNKYKELLGAYLDGELSTDDKEKVESHLKVCEECLQEISFLRKLNELPKRVPSIPQEKNYWESFPSRIKTEIEQRILEPQNREVKMFQDSFIKVEKNIGAKALIFPVSVIAHLIMGLISAEAYKASLNDGRKVYYKGEKVENVVTHPDLGVCADLMAIDYEMAEDPK